MSFSQYLLSSSLVLLARSQEISEEDLEAVCKFVDESYEMVLNFTTCEGDTVKSIIEYEFGTEAAETAKTSVDYFALYYSPCGDYLSNGANGGSSSVCTTTSEGSDCNTVYGTSNGVTYHYDEDTETWTVEVSVQDMESSCPDNTRTATISWTCDSSVETFEVDSVEISEDDCDATISISSSWACIDNTETTTAADQSSGGPYSWFFHGSHLTRGFAFALLFVAFLMAIIYCLAGYVWTKEAVNPEGSWLDYHSNIPNKTWCTGLPRSIGRSIYSGLKCLVSCSFCPSKPKTRRMQPYCTSVTPLINDSPNSVAYEQISDIEEL